MLSLYLLGHGVVGWCHISEAWISWGPRAGVWSGWRELAACGWPCVPRWTWSGSCVSWAPKSWVQAGSPWRKSKPTAPKHSGASGLQELSRDPMYVSLRLGLNYPATCLRWLQLVDDCTLPSVVLQELDVSKGSRVRGSTRRKPWVLPGPLHS